MESNQDDQGEVWKRVVEREACPLHGYSGDSGKFDVNHG